MKKALILFWTICFSLLFVSCEQVVLEEPQPIVVPKPLIEITNILPSGCIPYNTSATITYKNSNTAKCTVNGQEINRSGGEFNTGTLTSTTTFSFVSTGDGGSDKEDVTINVSAPPTPPTIVVDKTNFIDKLNFGDKTNFSWKAEGEITSVALNDIPVEKEGSKFTGSLFENTEYTLKVVGPGGERTEKLSIAVGYWTTSALGILQHCNRWIVQKNSRLNSNKEFVRDVVFDVKQEVSFSKEFKYVIYWDGKSVSYGDFLLKDNNTTLWFQDAPVTITKINKDALVYIQKSSSDDTYLEYVCAPEP